MTRDVEEALFLAQRVIVLSDRPASIKADVPVELPYPRIAVTRVWLSYAAKCSAR